MNSVSEQAEGKWEKISGHRSNASVTLGAFFFSPFPPEERLEERERLEVAVGKGEAESTARELPRGVRSCILQASRERVFGSRPRFQRVKFYHAARSGWDLLLGTKRDTDQNQLGQVTSPSLMSVDVF